MNSAQTSSVAHVFAAPGAVGAVPGSAVAGVGQVTLALCIVLGAIFLCAWLVRRMRNVGGGGAGALSVITEVRLGPKERAVLLQVGAAQVLVGVTPGQINALHVLAEPLDPQPVALVPAAAGERVSFKSLLRRSLGK